MIALYILFLVAFWIIVSIAAAIVIARKLPSRRWRVGGGIALAAVLITLPFDDQIVGGFQFRKLCEENSIIKVDRDKAKGRTVYVADRPLKEVDGTWVRVVEKDWTFLDVNTRETILSYRTFEARPRFIRVPLWFDSYCEPGGQLDQKKLLDEMGMTLVDRRGLGTSESESATAFVPTSVQRSPSGPRISSRIRSDGFGPCRPLRDSSWA